MADTTLSSYAAKRDTKLDALLRLTPKGCQGEKLKHKVKRFRQHFFVITNRNLPLTNNGSEQAIRPCVLFRKIANCFRSEWGASLYVDSRCGLETARRRSIDPLRAIRLTLSSQTLPARA